ncbi:low molecular weight phosphatase family protein [Nostocoides sp. HKS02]|uniref:arsenate reductase/protein-tyrosine-phosphatase family protein n=1 Tax=Nostocoides sp. HKS02 TaxID=1813880 RepID=UPI0012B4969E|nr:low molecular weight phosphatase family protein [Tetrasphaera sp. HKS02]QGN58933.1 low molecular weight phosphatase family protein [Tetrasphaera sp. HKS02]
MSSSARILTVCTGNICRSPFLERTLQSELDRSWGPGEVQVHSAGTGALTGSAMDPEARARLEAQGYAANGFVARDLTADLVAGADLVLTATRAHRGKVAAVHPRALRYVFAFREFADLVTGVSDDDLQVPSADAGEHIRRVVALAAAQRGARPPLDDSEADIVDPYRRAAEVFDQMTGQIMAALPTVARALGRP